MPSRSELPLGSWTIDKVCSLPSFSLVIGPAPEAIISSVAAYPKHHTIAIANPAIEATMCVGAVCSIPILTLGQASNRRLHLASSPFAVRQSSFRRTPRTALQTGDGLYADWVNPLPGDVLCLLRVASHHTASYNLSPTGPVPASARRGLVHMTGMLPPSPKPVTASGKQRAVCSKFQPVGLEQSIRRGFQLFGTSSLSHQSSLPWPRGDPRHDSSRNQAPSKRCGIMRLK